MLVLLAEDETHLAELIIDYLEEFDIDCDYAADGQHAINLLAQQKYDLVILDVMMPKLDGYQVCQQIKQSAIQTPVIFLTAQGALSDKLKGFELGADDYLTKPFAMEELLARVKVLGRRKSLNRHKFCVEDLEADLQSKRLSRQDIEIQLSAAQWTLLECLLLASPDVVTKAHLTQRLWPDQDIAPEVLKTQLARLRQKVNLPGMPPLIHTIRGQGICLKK